MTFAESCLLIGIGADVFFNFMYYHWYLWPPLIFALYIFYNFILMCYTSNNPQVKA